MGGIITSCRLQAGVDSMLEARISRSTLNLPILIKQFSHSDAGARVFFSGEVRASNHKKAVKYLEYSAHIPLAEKHMREVLEKAIEEYKIFGALCVHRVGRLLVSESAVAVLTLGRHRDETYMANRYILNRVKAETPIWKQEFFVDGTCMWGENCSESSDHLVEFAKETSHSHHHA